MIVPIRIDDFSKAGIKHMDPYMMTDESRCGYVALMGLPNSGKSTLLNACLGRKIVGVSKRPQTTRNRILGIDMLGEHQVIFLDSPGIHESAGKPKISRIMNRIAWSVAAEADIVCYLIDALKGWSDKDELCLKLLLEHSPVPIHVILSKADAVKKQLLDERLRDVAEHMARLSAETEGKGLRQSCVTHVESLSAKRKEELLAFRRALAELLPKGPWLYDSEDLTDQSENFVLAELIRECLFRRLSEELPYGCGVRVEALKHEAQKTLVKADIFVTRESHKPMVIGQKGRGIKAIGMAARENLERYFERKVRLELSVRVEKDWVNQPALIAELQQATVLSDSEMSSGYQAMQ